MVNDSLEIRRDEEYIYVPIKDASSIILATIGSQVPNIEQCRLDFHIRRKSQGSLIELLEDKLPPNLLASLPQGIDLVGDIAIVEIPPELELHKNIVGEAIIRSHKNTRTVLTKIGAVKGAYRLRQLQIIAGESKTETIHKENGCTYHVDVAKAYFSPRLSHEHSRISSLVREGEVVIDMFAGIGPFAIQIAKNHQRVSLYAMDINPNAIKYLTENARLNRVEEKVHPLLGDAKQIIQQKLGRIADRVIMNLPERAINYVDSACEALKTTGGTVHFYGFATKTNMPENLTQKFKERVEESGRMVVKSSWKRVRETAPFEFQIALDAEIN